MSAIKELLDIDGMAADRAELLLREIAGAKSKKHYGGSVIANYNTYDFSFADDTMVISGLAEDDAVFRLPLSEFIDELEMLCNL